MLDEMVGKECESKTRSEIHALLREGHLEDKEVKVRDLREKHQEALPWCRVCFSGALLSVLRKSPLRLFCTKSMSALGCFWALSSGTDGVDAGEVTVDYLGHKDGPWLYS